MQLTLWAFDLLAILLSVQIAVILSTGHFVLLTNGFKSIAAAYCFFLTILFYITDLYDPRRIQRNYETAVAVAFDAGISAALVTLTFYFFPYWKMGRSFFLIILFSTPVLVMAARFLCSHLYGHLAHVLTMGLLGGGPGMEDLRQLAVDRGLKVVDLPIMGNRDSLIANRSQSVLPHDEPIQFRSELARLQPDFIVLKPSVSFDPTATNELVNARFSGVSVLDFPTTFQMLSGKLPLDHMAPRWFLNVEGFRSFESNIVGRMKRLLDFGLASTLILALFPLFFLTALGVIIFSKGYLFHLHERVGLKGQIFRLFKFRTIRGAADSQGLWKKEEVSRLFGFGRLLKSTKLDGLPQLINVVKGDMSFVGPKAISPDLAERCRSANPYHELRNVVRPGITGWAQINRQSGSSLQDEFENLKYDLFYIEHLSLLLDLKIVMKTIRGARYRKSSH